MRGTIKCLLRLSVILLVPSLYGPGTAAAQQAETTLEILTSTVWIQGCAVHSDENTGDAKFFSFDQKTGKQTEYSHGYKIMEFSFSYYLSDTPDEKYDKKKEGKIPNGKYIIYKITDLGSDNFVSGLGKKVKVKKIPHSSYELLKCTPDEITVSSMGVEDVFVPCYDPETEEQRFKKF